jgi:hypothetical protein
MATIPGEKFTTSFMAKGRQSLAIATPTDSTENIHSAASGESISKDGRPYRSSRGMLCDLEAKMTKLRNARDVKSKS